MTAPALVGLMGQKRSGKDSAAAFLTVRRGFVRLGFADALRASLLHLNPLVGRGDLRVADVIDAVGWEGSKGSPSGPEIRRLLQEYGMAIREIEPDFWLRVVTREAARVREGYTSERTGRIAPPTPVVVTDVRFPNEADALRAQGGTIVRIERPGLPDDDGHPSEHAWRDVRADYTITNEGTLEDLGGAILFIADRLDGFAAD